MVKNHRTKRSTQREMSCSATLRKYLVSTNIHCCIIPKYETLVWDIQLLLIDFQCFTELNSFLKSLLFTVASEDNNFESLRSFGRCCGQKRSQTQTEQETASRQIKEMKTKLRGFMHLTHCRSEPEPGTEGDHENTPARCRSPAERDLWHVRS